MSNFEDIFNALNERQTVEQHKRDTRSSDLESSLNAGPIQLGIGLIRRKTHPKLNAGSISLCR